MAVVQTVGRQRARTGAAWIALSALSYSLLAIFGELVLDDLEPVDIVFWRFLITVPIAWAIVGVRRRRGGPGPQAAPIPTFFLGGLFFGVMALLVFVALDHLSASLYTVLIYTYPAMVAAGSALVGRRPPPVVWAAIGMTTLGIALTVPEVLSGDADADMFGLLMCLLNAAIYSVYLLLIGDILSGRRPGAPVTDGFVASAWSQSGSFVFAVVVAAFVGLSRPPSWQVWLGLAAMAVVCTIVANLALFIAMRTVAPATAAVIATFEPVLTMVWAVTLLGETLVAVQVIGAALVIGGVVWAQRATA